MSIIKAIKQSFIDKERKGFDKLFYFVDLHSTAIKPNYSAKSLPTEFYPMAKEALQLLSNSDEICLIMYTCSQPDEVAQYVQFFKDNGIVFEYVNENPEVTTEKGGYGNYDTKPYINVLMDDKAGFDGEEDWFKIHAYFSEKYNLPTEPVVPKKKFTPKEIFEIELLTTVEPIFNKYPTLKAIPLLCWGRFYKYESAGSPFFSTSGESFLTHNIKDRLDNVLLDKIYDDALIEMRLYDEDLSENPEVGIVSSFMDKLWEKYDSESDFYRKKCVGFYGFDDRGGRTLVAVKNNNILSIESWDSDTWE